MFKHLFVFPSLSNVCPQLFHFFLARQVFQALCLCVCFWLFLRSHNLSMLELVVTFPVTSFFVLVFFLFHWKVIFVKLESIFLQKVFAPPAPGCFRLVWSDQTYIVFRNQMDAFCFWLTGQNIWTILKDFFVEECRHLITWQHLIWLKWCWKSQQWKAAEHHGTYKLAEASFCRKKTPKRYVSLPVRKKRTFMVLRWILVVLAAFPNGNVTE